MGTPVDFSPNWCARSNCHLIKSKPVRLTSSSAYFQMLEGKVRHLSGSCTGPLLELELQLQRQ